MENDDAILQKPEDLHLLVPIFHTTSACAGSVTAHLLRRIAYRAGAYAPGIQEQLFHELNIPVDGGSIESVQTWFAIRTKKLTQLGYRLQCRRTTLPTSALLEWVHGGKGYRGAMLPTNFRRLHPTSSGGGVEHAVGITVDRLNPGLPNTFDELVMIDPWPGIGDAAHDRGKISPHLETAHKERGYHALMFYWIGWS